MRVRLGLFQHYLINMYAVKYTDDFERDFKKLDRTVQKRILKKIENLAYHPELIERVRHTPDALRGLCKYRVGDWRIFLWVYHEERIIKLYGVEHRGTAYRRF